MKDSYLQYPSQKKKNKDFKKSMGFDETPSSKLM
jgi:hypothetical protein